MPAELKRWTVTYYTGAFNSHVLSITVEAVGRNRAMRKAANTLINRGTDPEELTILGASADGSDPNSERNPQ